MTFTMNNVGEQLSPERIAAFEKEIGRVIPKEYQEFLLKYNGGSPSPSGFEAQTPQGIDPHMSIEFFLGINRSSKSTSIDYFIQSRKGRLPERFFPIGRCSSSVICISTSGEDEGQIKFWDSEFESDSEEPTEENLYFIANSFAQFLEMLH